MEVRNKQAAIIYTPDGAPIRFNNVEVISTTSPELEIEGDDSSGDRHHILTNLGYILETEMPL